MLVPRPHKQQKGGPAPQPRPQRLPAHNSEQSQNGTRKFSKNAHRPGRGRRSGQGVSASPRQEQQSPSSTTMTKTRKKDQKSREKCPPGSGELPSTLLETTPSVHDVLTSLTNEEVVVGSKPLMSLLLHSAYLARSASYGSLYAYIQPVYITTLICSLKFD